MLDGNGKKTRFVTQAAAELRLENVTVVHSRVEEFHPQAPFDSVVSRAFASIADMLRSCAHLVASDGRYLAMKGGFPQQELDDLPPGFELTASHRLVVPGLDAERHLLCLRPCS